MSDIHHASPFLLRVLILMATLIVAASSVAHADSAARTLLHTAKTWGYQLQNVTAAALAKHDFDVLVVDAGDGAGAWGLSKREVARLQRKRDGTRRLVLAYMNIGEAEDYRYYWRPGWAKQPPDWMGSANCRWKGDHRVRHWAPQWQAILFGSPHSYLGRLLDLGYDGVYLDRVDIYTHWQSARTTAFAEMVDLVARLSQWAKARRAGFLVLPQNGEALLEDDRYLAAIDGLGKEDMLYGDNGNDVANDPARVERAERHIARARAAGLPVFAIEYARAHANIERARTRLAALGYVAYFGPRSLAYIGQDGPVHPEDGDTESVAATTTPDQACE